MHHALGVAGGAGGEKHRRHIAGLNFGDFVAEPGRVLAGKSLARFNQGVECVQTRLVVLAQAARVVVVDVGDLRATLADFDQLIDLLLVFDHRKAHFGVVERKNAFGADRVLVQRNRNRAQRLHGQHGGVQARAVGADDDHVLTAREARLVQSGGQLLDQASEC